MGPPDVLVVGETPSLGQAIADLLESDGLPVRYVALARLAPAELDPPGTASVVVAACNAARCVTAQRWRDGRYPGTQLVVVGSRDPQIVLAEGARLVELPVEPSSFLGLIRSMLTGAGPTAGDPAGRGPAGRAPPGG